MSPDGLCEGFREHQWREQHSAVMRKKREGETKQQDRKIAFVQVPGEATGVLLSVPAVSMLRYFRPLPKLLIVYLKIQALD